MNDGKDTFSYVELGDWIEIDDCSYKDGYVYPLGIVPNGWLQPMPPTKLQDYIDECNALIRDANEYFDLMQESDNMDLKCDSKLWLRKISKKVYQIENIIDNAQYDEDSVKIIETMHSIEIQLVEASKNIEKIFKFVVSVRGGNEILK